MYAGFVCFINVGMCVYILLTLSASVWECAHRGGRQKQVCLIGLA